MPDNRDYAQMTVVVLKSLLEDRDLSKTGKKAELVARLEQNDEESSQQLEQDNNVQASTGTSNEEVQEQLQESAPDGTDVGKTPPIQGDLREAVVENGKQNLDEQTIAADSEENGVTDSNERQGSDGAALTATQEIVQGLREPVADGSSEKYEDDTHIDTAVGPSHPQQTNAVPSGHEAIIGTGSEIKDAPAVPAGAEIPQAERNIDSVAENVKAVPPPQGGDKEIGAGMAITDADLTAESVAEDKSNIATNDAEELKRKREIDEVNIENTVTKKLKEEGLKPIGGSSLLKEEAVPEDFHPEQARTARQNSPNLSGTNDAELMTKQHSETRALYIANLIRPIASNALEAHLSTLGGETPALLYLDPLKTHAYVVFESLQASRNARSKLNGRRWPDEPHRKALVVDHILESSVSEFIRLEKEAPKGTKWEVVYNLAHGQAVASLCELGSGQSLKGHVDEETERSESDRPIRATKILKLDDLFKKTVAKPTLYYCPRNR